MARAFETVGKWHSGRIGAVSGANKNGVIYEWNAKVYDEPSAEYGLNGSRVSKLTIRTTDSAASAARDVYRYERGEDLPPANDEVAAIINIILSKFS